LALIGLTELLTGLALVAWQPDLKGAGHFLAGIGGVVLLAAAVWAHNEPAPGRLPALGWAAFWLVQLQGLLGGLRVVWLADEIGVFHGVLAQGFLFLLVAVAVLGSAWWRRLPPVTVSPILRRWLWLATWLVVLQLVLGATMRHRHAGLAVPDFPLAHGQVWPRTDPEAIAGYNRQRIEVHAARPIAAADVWLHMLHRLGAVAVLLTVAATTWQARRRLPAGHPLRRTVLAWLGLVAAQFALGALTVWTNKAADVATAHVVFGSLALVTGGLTCLMAGRRAPAVAATVPAASNPTQDHPPRPAWSAAA
jgi:cytochrome c oxidase assembly protein subunit 15